MEKRTTIKAAALAFVLSALLLSAAACNPESPLPTPPTSPIAPATLQQNQTGPTPATTEHRPTPTPPPAVPTAKPPEASPTPVPAEPDPEPAAHVVQPGESLLRLATTHEVPIAAIQLASGLGDRISLRAGEVLTIPLPAGWEHATPYWILHQVEAGETMSSIAANYGVKLTELQEANQAVNPNALAIGQMLILPLADPSALVQLSAPPASAGSGGASGSPAEPLPPINIPADVAGWPYAVFQLINQQRAAHGLYPLAYNETLARAAQLHAQDCQQRGYCGHVGSDGTRVMERVLRAGYPAAGAGECWVQTNAPDKAVNWWMDEVPPNDPHRRTLLSTYFTEVGVGIAAAEWGYYFIANFGTQ